MALFTKVPVQFNFVKLKTSCDIALDSRGPGNVSLIGPHEVNAFPPRLDNH